MGDLIVAGNIFVAIWLAITGFGFFLGFGFKERNKCWASEKATKNLWKRTKAREYYEYFPED